MNHSSSFVHLHVHSEYSLLEASCAVKDLVQKAAEFKMPAVALTDNGNMFGAIEFYFACQDKHKEYGVKPILGLDVYMAPFGRMKKAQDRESIAKPNTRLVLLAQDIEGYRNLCQISTIGYQEGFYYKPRVDYEVLQKINKNIICLSGGLRGEIAQVFLTEGPEKALEKIRWLKEIFGDRFYLELNRTGLSEWNQINLFLLEAAKICGVSVVAANDVHYLTRDDQMSQEVLVCIGTNKTLIDESRFRLGTDQFYLKSSEQMRELFRDIPEACDHTLEIAERCNVKFKLKDDFGKMIYHLPSFPTQDGRSLQEEVERISKEGLELRFKEAATRGETVSDSQKQHYYERLKFEISIIERMGFTGYFLIVADFINWAKEHDIPVGPGRGSGAGSIVAFSLRITDLDPIPHNLLFERFLNPERISMPDFDIDFCQDRRQEVIRYVTEKYGSASVSQIITYGKLQAKAAIKDVGRVLGMLLSEVDAVSKLIPEKPGTTLDGALEQEPRLREMIELNPQVATLFDLAKKIEGLVRHSGIHAAGVVIADGELVQHAPLCRGTDGESVIQYDMKHAEKIGLIKFDFLGLKTLTLINRAFKLIKKNHGKDISTQNISLSDPGIYEIMSCGDTAGIFQFEGDGITSAIRQIKPNNFADITAINALYRPGPMAMIPEFAKRKHGEAAVEYLFPELKTCLEETYGIIVYQEQVMGIASLIAGYSLGEADLLRRAMGKKNKEEMDRHRVRFLEGAKNRGHDEKKSEELFELMYKFADYGFNKSHAAAYCVVAAYTAWLKNYYPTEFFAALLSTELGDSDKVVRYVKDAQKRGIKVLSPHINYSDYLFNVQGEDIYFALGAIKGLGEVAIKAIVEAREKMPNKKFESLEEFFENVDVRKLNKKSIECLIRAGALDGFGGHRAQLKAGYQKFLDRAQKVVKDREVGQISLFDLCPSSESKVMLDPFKPWSRTAALAYEKEVLGFYLSDHPLKGFENLAKVWVTCNIGQLSQVAEKHKTEESSVESNKKKKRVIVSGLLTDSRELITKKGTRMAFSKIEDLTGSCELVIFPDAFIKVESFLKDERPMLVGGLLESEESSVKIFLDTMIPLEEVFKKTKRMTCRLDKVPEHNYEKLMSLFNEFPGTTKVDFILRLSEFEKDVSLEVENFQGVSFDNDFLENIQSFFGNTDFIEVRNV